jgi:hypothetical protein
MSDRTTITVLGAGGTAACGYPCAIDLFPQVKRFGDTLGEDCRHLKLAINFVVAKADELHCTTPDELAFQMHQRRIGGLGHYNTAIRTLAYARIATDAFFLKLEQDISPAATQRIARLWHEVLGPFTDEWFSAFPSTKHRVVTFNYDRVLELVFSQSFQSICGSRDLLGPEVLNAGLGHFSGLTFAPDRFCYLKLHGTVGIEPIGDNEIAWHHGDRFHYYAGLGGSAPASDALYFEEAVDEETGLPKPKLHPLIAFPVDKQRIEGLGSDYNLEKYIKAMRVQAERIFSEAEEIRVIGYSFAAPDKNWLVDLMRRATKARILVHHPEAKSICRELIEYDRLPNVTALDGYW